MRRILLVRHGQSDGNVDDAFYMDPGDPLIELTTTGWQQAREAGQFLRYYYRNNPTADSNPPPIWPSTFLRTRQTTKGILEGMGLPDDHPVRQDMRLVEQTYGAGCWAGKDELARKLYDLSEDVYHANPILTPLPLGESLMQQFMRVDSFMGTLHRDERRQGIDDVLIVAHGVTIKNFLMRWFHIPDYEWKKLKTPHNCDVFELLQGEKGWQVRKIYDGELKRIFRRDPLGGVSYGQGPVIL